MFVDSSFIVALVNDRDRNHARALTLAGEYLRRPTVTTDAVLLEAGNSLSRRFRKKAVDVITEFLTSPESQVIPLSPDLFREALAMYDRHQDKDWGLVDCVSFVVMKREKLIEALAFDHHFTQAGFRTL